MSQNEINLGNLDMLRSLYDFKESHQGTLSFRTNDYFILHQTITKHKDWWEVMNEKGQMGYIPSNYMEKIIVSPTFYLQYLETCIDYVQRNEVSPEKDETLLRLKEMRRNVDRLPETNINSIGAAGDDNMPYLLLKTSEGRLETVKGVPFVESDSDCLVRSNSRSDIVRESSNGDSKLVRENSHSESSHVEVQSEKSEKSLKIEAEKEEVDISPVITATAVYELVDSVRVNTQLSYNMSRAAVSTVIHGLHDLLPASVFPYLSTIQTLLETTTTAATTPSDINNAIIGNDTKGASTDDVTNAALTTYDAKRLKIIFEELTSCKDDIQQRSWMCYEDEPTIVEYLTELLSILTNADASISRHMIANSHYLALDSLLQYYQMETRWRIRELLLQTFGVMCGLDSTVMSVLVNSVVVCEIARDMKSNERFVAKLSYSALLLTMAFSMGERLPVNHIHYFDVDFWTFIFRLIENPPETDEDEQIPDLFLNLILSFNLQYSNHIEWRSENQIIRALYVRDAYKAFTQKALLLLNRDEDPVRIFDHKGAPGHSVVKLFVDIFSNEVTSKIFYTNDVKVLIDITVRNLLDLSEKEPRRHDYLKICREILRNTNYSEYNHRFEDIRISFDRIYNESSPNKNDQILLELIYQEFPDLAL